MYIWSITLVPSLYPDIYLIHYSGSNPTLIYRWSLLWFLPYPDIYLIHYSGSYPTLIYIWSITLIHYSCSYTTLIYIWSIALVPTLPWYISNPLLWFLPYPDIYLIPTLVPTLPWHILLSSPTLPYPNIYLRYYSGSYPTLIYIYAITLVPTLPWYIYMIHYSSSSLISHYSLIYYSGFIIKVGEQCNWIPLILKLIGLKSLLTNYHHLL